MVKFSMNIHKYCFQYIIISIYQLCILFIIQSLLEMREAKSGDILLLTLLGLIWGSSFFNIKIATYSYEPFTLALIRVIFASLPLLILCWYKKIKVLAFSENSNFEKIEIPRDTGIVEYFGLEKEYSRRVFPARVLPSRTGELTEEGRRASPGDPRGFITHGPYAHLWPGRYSISIQYQLLDAAESSRYWEVTSELGAITLYKKTSFEPTASEAETSSVEFTLKESAANVELRAFYGGEGALTVRSVVLEKL